MNNALAEIKSILTNYGDIAFEKKRIYKPLMEELVRQLQMWQKDINNIKGLNREKTSVLLDVTTSIIDIDNSIQYQKINDLIKEENLVLSYFDKYLFNAYCNWIVHERILKRRGFHRSNPYIPYIEFFKRGGKYLKYEYGHFEALPYFHVCVYPINKYQIEQPFIDLDNIDNFD